MMSAMGARADDAGRSRNLHAPWRIGYIRSLGEADDGCFLCRARDQADRAEENLLLWRTERCLAVMNKYPYSAGHLLVAPAEHVGGLEGLEASALGELMALTRDSVRLLGETVKAEGFNVGINIGRCAGAGLPDHVHLHVVPRWSGDTNFMSVLGDVRVVHQALRELRGELLAAGERLRLPDVLYAR